jgi:2-oxoglutarate dehydrogenase complex dehydrogenase (E1) component-like enzyme
MTQSVGLLITFVQLMVFSSKSLLRYPEARSELSDVTGDTHFQHYLSEQHPEDLVRPEEIRRHILCSSYASVIYVAHQLSPL